MYEKYVIATEFSIDEALNILSIASFEVMLKHDSACITPYKENSVAKIATDVATDII